MRFAIAAFLTLVASTSMTTQASANPVFMKPRFDNTMISVTHDGHVNRLYFKADGTLTGRYDTTPYIGTWEVKGDRVCVKIDPNRPGRPNPNCVPLFDRQVGQGWVNGDGPTAGTEMLVQGIR